MKNVIYLIYSFWLVRVFIDFVQLRFKRKNSNDLSYSRLLMSTCRQQWRTTFLTVSDPLFLNTIKKHTSISVICLFAWKFKIEQIFNLNKWIRQRINLVLQWICKNALDNFCRLVHCIIERWLHKLCWLSEQIDFKVHKIFNSRSMNLQTTS